MRLTPILIAVMLLLSLIGCTNGQVRFLDREPPNRIRGEIYLRELEQARHRGEFGPGEFRPMGATVVWDTTK